MVSIVMGCLIARGKVTGPVTTRGTPIHLNNMVSIVMGSLIARGKVTGPVTTRGTPIHLI